MFRKSLALAAVAGVLAAGIGPPAGAAHTETHTYLVTNLTPGAGVTLPVPNLAGQLPGMGAGGVTFNPTHAPRWIQITDEVTGRGGHAYSICQPGCDGGQEKSGCTPAGGSNPGRVTLGTNFVADETLRVWIWAYDPVFENCENNAFHGTVRLKYRNH